MKNFIHKGRMILESNQAITDLELAYQTFGELNKEKDNVIWAFHAISGNSNVMDWWPGIFGEEAIYNPKSYFIICANTLGSPFGSTMPADFNFPNFTVRDVVQAHILLAKELGITKIHTAIGGSFGGYQALEFAYSFLGEIDHLILLACSAKESAWGIAIHESQRMALKADITFGEKGEGKEGIKAARAIAMLTYRTSEVIIEEQTDTENRIDDFKASGYINYQGDKFSKSFDALSFYYLTKCIDSHNIGRNRGGEVLALQKIKIPTLVIGFNSDTLNPIRFQKFLAEHLPNSVFKGFDSEFGHDGFLLETDKITESINKFYSNTNSFKGSKRIVMKFGGSSLYGQEKLSDILSIIKNAQLKDTVAVVVSARGESTTMLIGLFNIAKNGQDFSKEIKAFVDYLYADGLDQNIDREISKLKLVLEAIKLLKDDSEFAYDRVLSFGEIISADSLTKWLVKNDVNAKFIDARSLIFTEKLFNEFEVNMDKSRLATQSMISKIESDVVPVITGFIASSEENKTVTLGRNGSNYTASLIANYIQAKEVQSWTDVQGVYSANPHIVPNAVKIGHMTYKEANEMANFGMNLLHPKTILPLRHGKIPLYIKSTSNPNEPGTCISQKGDVKGIKAVTSIHNVALVTIEGDELAQSIGIDARIFTCLGKSEISVKMISQASSERGIGFVISSESATEAELVLNKEFKNELRLQQISSIRMNSDIGIVSIIGRHNFALEKAISMLRRNEIWMHLISNSISGEHISLVVDKHLVNKAVRITHNEIFGVIKTMHVFAFGKGQVGSAFINQVLQTSTTIVQNRQIEIKIIGVSDSTRFLLKPAGLTGDWKNDLEKASLYKSIDQITKEIYNLHLDNVILVDNTSSEEISTYYPKFVKLKFDLVSSNKKFNSSELHNYIAFRKLLKQKGRHFYYEANVGAGLPIINFLNSLYASSDVVTKIRGVFSGSLSYIFNSYAKEMIPFSECLKNAKLKGYTEPDPREDLSGLDVARKLVILAREINYPANLKDVIVQNLIPDTLVHRSTYEEFMADTSTLDTFYQKMKDELKPNETLRYIAELDVQKGTMDVGLKTVQDDTPIGQIRNADTLFEIYTDSYKEQPVVIQGAGAGPEVTARGVYSDVLKIGH